MSVDGAVHRGGDTGESGATSRHRERAQSDRVVAFPHKARVDSRTGLTL